MRASITVSIHRAHGGSRSNRRRRGILLLLLLLLNLLLLLFILDVRSERELSDIDIGQEREVPADQLTRVVGL